MYRWRLASRYAPLWLRVGPNINNPRDPRFGRLSELPSEDPVHAGTYAAEFVRGMQEEDAAGHPKMIALLKHFTACERLIQTRQYTRINSA